MSTKLKELSKNASQSSLGNGLQSNQTVTPAEDVQMFDTVISSSQASDSNDSKQKTEEDQDKLSSVNSQNKKEKSAQTAQTEDAKEAGSESQTIAQDQKELDAMEQYRIDLAQLAQQLNVVLDSQQQVQVQQNQVQQAQTVLTGRLSVENIQNTVAQVDPQLLRKVDVKSLKQQLDLAVNPDETVDIKPPELVDTHLQATLQKIDDKTINIATPVDPLKPEKSDFKMENFLKADDFNVSDFFKDDKESNFIEDLQPVTDEIIKPEPDFLTKVMPLVSDKKPAVTMNIISVDLNRISREEISEQKESSYFSEMMAVKTLAEDASSSTDMPFQKISNSSSVDVNKLAQQIGQMQTLNAPVQHQGNLSHQPVFSNAYLAPIKTQVEGVVLQMSGNAKSGITRLQINPPELGAIDIKFQVKGDHVKAEIVTQSETTMELLQSHLQDLKDIMTSENLHVDQLGLRHDSNHFTESQNNNDNDHTRQDKQSADQSQSHKDEKNYFSSSNGNHTDNFAQNEQMEKLKLLLLNQRGQAKSSIDVTI